MNEELEFIKSLIERIIDLEDSISYISNDNYKCNHWEEYEDRYNELVTELNKVKKLLVSECNTYISYPKRSFLFFDLTKKVRFKKHEFFSTVLVVPFVDKREYYCLKNFFKENRKIIQDHWYDEYTIRRVSELQH